MSLPVSQRLTAGCKVNLGLRITGIRPNGYHELDSLFLPLAAPCDVLDISPLPADTPQLELHCAMPGLDLGHNTLTKAYQAFARRAQTPPPALRLHLTKGIPSGAGLGGGSSDAAVLLRWLNDTAPAPLTEQDLHLAALEVGADVPFFLMNCPCRVQGIGERLTPVRVDLPDTVLVLLCPGESISTPWAYGAYDAWCRLRDATPQDPGDLTNGAIRDTGTSLSSMPKADARCDAVFTREQALAMRNDLEAPVAATYPVITEMRQALLQAGAWAAVMSGSGSAMVGLFASATAPVAARALSRRWQAHICAIA